MKRVIGFSCVAVVLTVLLSFALLMASHVDYDDVAGHWAEPVLVQAFEEGLITGYNGRLYPDDYITIAESLTLLCRVLGVEATADITASGLSGDEWYYDTYAKAAYLGLTLPASATTPGAPVTRQEAFYLLAEAFQLSEADPDMAVLEQFSDSSLIAFRNRQALASLVSQEFINGSGVAIYPDSHISRASFLTLIYRVVGSRIPASAAECDYESGVMLQGSATLSLANFNGGVWFDCTASDLTLSSITADSAVIRSHSLDSLVLRGSTHIGRLTLAAQSGDISVSLTGNAVVDTLVVGDGGGEISVDGISAIEVTGDGRLVNISGDVDSVIVSGTDSTIRVESDAKIGRVVLTSGARGSNVVTDGEIADLEIRSLGSSVSGEGSVSLVGLHRTDTVVSVAHDDLEDHFDIGITGATILLRTTGTLPVGEALVAAAIVENVLPGIECSAVWYLDGITVSDTTMTTGDILPAFRHSFEYSRDMPESAEVKLVVSYTTELGEKQEISAVSTVIIENYSRQHWMMLDAPEVLEKVTIGYLGDFTLEWAEANDLDPYDKVVWVNAKGFTSTSEYLLWINLAYQRVNIFRRADDGQWELIRECIVGTGAPGRGTPPGVWTTSYKQVNGWNTGSYTVKPVARFRDSSGYAFHSRLYYPGTTNVQDPSIGFPVSAGCVRMYDEDIWFIFDYIPEGTTVVVH